MAISRIGSVEEVNSSANASSASITVPGDCTYLLVFVNGYENLTNFFSSGTLTLNGVGLTEVEIPDSNTALPMGCLWEMIAPPTGSQTLAWDWGGASAADEGVIFAVWYGKGVDQATPRRDSGSEQSTEPNLPASTGTMTAQTGDKIVAGVGLYSVDGGTPDWTNVTEIFDSGQFNSDTLRVAEGDPTGDTEVTGGNNPWGAVVMGVVLIPAAGDDNSGFRLLENGTDNRVLEDGTTFRILEGDDPTPPPNAGAVTGSVAWVGSATGITQRRGAASGAVAWVGSATGKRTPKAGATGAITWAGAATGEAPPNRGAGNGSISRVGAATGTSAYRGSATGGIGWTGAAVGETTRAGASTGSIAWTGAVSGEIDVEGAASGNITWTGTATGRRTSRGAGNGSVAWVGSVLGIAPPIAQDGSADGSIAWVGSATGTTQPEGAGTGAVSWAGTATGTAPYQGAAGGNIVWNGSATGMSQHVATSSGTISWAGGAVGEETSHIFWVPDPVAFTPVELSSGSGVVYTRAPVPYVPFE